MSRFILESMFTLVAMCSFGFAQEAAVVTIMPGADNHMSVVIDPQIHQDYGVTYPLTYEFSLPQGASGLRAYKRHSSAAEWIQLPDMTSDDFFNAVEVVRFEYASGRALVSVGFAAVSDTICLKVTDSLGQNAPITFNRICRYYDDRVAVVSCSADDYADWNLTNFLRTIGNFRSKHLWLSVAVNTAACNRKSFDSLQVELDRGYVEASAHSRSHPQGPFAQPDSEVTGCKLDLIAYLDMPPLFRNGSREYVYTWVAPYGYDDQVIHSLLGRDRFLANRQYYYSDQSAADFPAWDAGNGVYSPFGVSREVGPAMAGFIGTGDSTDLNTAFDDAVARGGIYYLMCHPSIVEWTKAYTWSHLNYVSDRKDIWYASLGQLFVYHFAQERYQYTPTSVAENTPSAPAEFTLNQNYPNPFNPSTTIRYGLPERTHVRLTIFNALGQQVAALVEGEQEAGDHEVQFNASELASGVYLYRLQVRPLDFPPSGIPPNAGFDKSGTAIGRDSKSGAGNFVQTRKLLLLR